jgi:hypothetical protein
MQFYRILCLVLGAFAKFRKAAVSFVKSVRLYEKTRLPLDEFLEIWYVIIFGQSFEKMQVSFESDKNNAYFT